jgi:hypothetical protein
MPAFVSLGVVSSCLFPVMLVVTTPNGSMRPRASLDQSGKLLRPAPAVALDARSRWQPMQWSTAIGKGCSVHLYLPPRSPTITAGGGLTERSVPASLKSLGLTLLRRFSEPLWVRFAIFSGDHRARPGDARARCRGSVLSASTIGVNVDSTAAAKSRRVPPQIAPSSNQAGQLPSKPWRLKGDPQ